VKIGRLKRRADVLAEDAWTERREYKEHASKSLCILRRRVGSTAGLAISFSLGFMTGSGTDARKDKGNHRGEYDREHGGAGKDKGITHQLVHGPLGDSAIKLASAVVARSLMKFMHNESAKTRSSVTRPASSEGPLT
jgi:hypothetical protein